jgi:hypothetical protein
MKVTVFEKERPTLIFIDDGSDLALIPSAIDAFPKRQFFFCGRVQSKERSGYKQTTNYNGQSQIYES